MKKIILAAAALLTLGLAACAVETAPSETAANASTEALSTAGYNQHCGGNIAHPVNCATGLVCSHTDATGKLINPDMPGVCLEGAGQACGGNMTTAKVCAAGFACTPHGTINVGDVGGTCAPVSQYGGSCGGNKANAPVCATGLACSHVTPGGVVIFPDLPGMCLEGAGQACGGNMSTAKSCAAPLVCKAQGTLPVGDVGGLCK